MGNNVGVNFQSIVTKKSNGIVSNFPDVCKTPVGNAVVPIPYPNIAFSRDLEKGSKNVKVNGVPACVKDADFSTSVGDEAGTLKGVASSMNKGIAQPVNYSMNVKIEGRGAVRNLDLFLSNNRNTPPIPLMQPPVMPVIPGMEGDSQAKTYKCDWKDCSGKHFSKVTYKNDGCVKRGTYSGTWEKPWSKGAGQDSTRISVSHYENEPGKATSLDAAKTLFGSGEYVTNNHHLIPVASMKKFSVLSHNAKLVGFDINDGKYGICLPYFITDIFRHDLQSHKTNHRNYSKKVEKLLKGVQKECKKYCEQSMQQKVITDLTQITVELRQCIVDWEEPWLLRKDAIEDREKSFKWAGLPVPK